MLIKILPNLNCFQSSERLKAVGFVDTQAIQADITSSKNEEWEAKLLIAGRGDLNNFESIANFISEVKTN